MTSKPPKPKAKTTPTVAVHEKSLASGLKIWQMDLIACALILFAVIALFHQIVLENKVFSAGDDTITATSMNEFAVRESNVREYPMWCQYVFGGFPSLAAGAYSNYEHWGMPYSLASKYLSPRYWADIVTIKGLFFGVFMGDGARWYLSILLYAGLLTYLLMRRLKFSVMIALFSALLMAWNPYFISLITASHGGKLLTFVYTPLVLLLAYNVMEKRRLLDLGLLAVAFGWQIAVGGHTQILFYSFVAVGLLFVVWAVQEFREKKSVMAFTPALWIGLALVLGFGVGALWYVPLAEYVPYSIRGMGPAFDISGQGGYSIADATMWSFHPSELLTFIVPSWLGLKSPYYWGEMPFTSSSFYFGVVPLLFAVIAFWGKKDRFFWGLTVISIFSLLLSFGKHFESYYSLFFNYLPFFNKFRTPSLIILLVVLSAIVMAGYGIRYVLSLERDEKWRKIFLYGMIICAAIMFIMLISGEALSGLFGSFAKTGEEAQYKPEQLTQLHSLRFAMLKKDLIISMLWLGLAFTACYLKLQGKLKQGAFVGALIGITVLDLAIFDNKFFEPQQAASQLDDLKTNKVIEYLQQQDKATFRVMPIGKLFQDVRWAYWQVPSIGGHAGAKMRSYQDLLDKVIYQGTDPKIPLNIPYLSSMNCKYYVAEGMLPPELGFEQVLVDNNAKLALFRNPRALERVYFVDSTEVITDRKAVINRMLQPGFAYDADAIIDQSLPGPIKRDSLRKANITSYVPHSVKIKASNGQPSFMVLSDAYYAPGWEAIDNGSPAKIYKVNGYVRGLYLQPGQHDIEFRYVGKTERRGMVIATVSHFLVWGLVICGYFIIRKRKDSEEIQDEVKDEG